ncbi:MAG: hypothetical protein ACXVDU_02475 [Bacteroidia bacterium]
MEWWSTVKQEKFASGKKSRMGDLYKISFLTGFTDTIDNVKLAEYKTAKHPIDLYILHDSYLEGRLKKENFVGVDTLVMSHYAGAGVKVNLNKKKYNILILECSERTIDWRMRDVSLLYPKLYTKQPPVDIKNGLPEEWKNYFFNPVINQNLEFNLYNYELFAPVKEFKANLIYSLFHKTPNDVAVSSNGKYLLLNETVNPSYNESSFRRLTNANIDETTYNMNLREAYYRNMGFDKVYFSIIPNPVSIVDPWRIHHLYNHKIERIKSVVWRNFPMIDVYNTFMTTKKHIYRRDDSHWNTSGVQLWVNEVNSQLLLFK